MFSCFHCTAYKSSVTETKNDNCLSGGKRHLGLTMDINALPRGTGFEPLIEETYSLHPYSRSALTYVNVNAEAIVFLGMKTLRQAGSSVSKDLGQIKLVTRSFSLVNSTGAPAICSRSRSSSSSQGKWDSFIKFKKFVAQFFNKISHLGKNMVKYLSPFYPGRKNPIKWPLPLPFSGGKIWKGPSIVPLQR